MSILDLYCQIAREKLGMDVTSEPDAKLDSKKMVKEVGKMKPSTSSSKFTKKRNLSSERINPPTKKRKATKTVECDSTHKKMTDDGFKIVSELDLPADDSDISDAFVSDLEDEAEVEMTKIKPQKVKKTKEEKIDTKPPKSLSKSVDSLKKVSSKSQFTEDGFRIVSHIPDDDSDVSDAFKSDGSDCEDDSENLPPTNSSCNQLSKKDSGVNSESKSFVVGYMTETVKEVAVDTTEDEVKKKHKRGARKKNKAGSDKELPNPMKKKKDADKKNRKPKKPPVVLSEEDLKYLKSKIPEKIQKLIIEFGLNWADFDRPEWKEERELSKLPQPAQIANCVTYLKKDKTTGKVITVRDYSKKRGGALSGAAVSTVTGAPPNTGPAAGNAPKNAAGTTVTANGIKRPAGTDKVASLALAKANKKIKPGEQPLTQEQLELIEKKKQMKAEHLEELRAIKQKIVNKVINKSLDPRTKDQKRLAVIEKLGGVVKKPYVNYKVLQANKKKEKEEVEAKRENLKNLGMHDMLKKKRRERRKKDPNEVGGFNSLGGRIRDGVMVIGKKDMAKMTS